MAKPKAAFVGGGVGIKGALKGFLQPFNQGNTSKNKSRNSKTNKSSGGGGAQSFGSPSGTLTNYSLDDLYGMLGGGSYSGGGGGYTPIKTDISGLLAAYDQQAESAKNIAKSTYDTTRNDLLTSLKRFQEQNAKDQLTQRQQYLTGQSSLEAAREQANRQSRISAAARGLGGSGLQQLAQMQNLLSQSEDVSKLANENQTTMDKLRTLLRQEEEDTNTNLEKALTTYNNTLNNIASTLASQKGQAIYENERAYANDVNAARAQAAASRASASSSNAATRREAQALYNDLNNINSNLNSALSDLSKMSNKEVKAYSKQLGLSATKNKTTVANALRDNALAQLGELNSEYGVSVNNYNAATNNIYTLLSRYGYGSGGNTIGGFR